MEEEELQRRSLQKQDQLGLLHLPPGVSRGWKLTDEELDTLQRVFGNITPQWHTGYQQMEKIAQQDLLSFASFSHTLHEIPSIADRSSPPTDSSSTKAKAKTLPPTRPDVRDCLPRSVKYRRAPLLLKGDPTAIETVEVSRMIGELSSKFHD